MSTRKSNSATLRLKQDYLRLKKDPVPYVTAEPVPSNILEWHYIVEGPDGSPYHNGIYHGKLVFPREFPFKPPSIYMITPNGRFKCNTRLCLSISDFHPDTWNPAWSVSTILTGLLSFMLETSPTLGSVETSNFEKKQLALQSIEFNLKDSLFCELFPDVVTSSMAEIKKRNEIRNSLPNSANGVNNLVRDQFNHEQSNLQAAITNICVLVGVAAFAYIVRYVIRNLANDFHD